MRDPGEHPLAEIHAWHDGKLPGADRSRVEAHLKGCPACRSELEALRALDAKLRPAEAPASPELLGMLGRAMDAEDARRRAARRRARWVGAVAGVAAAALLAVVLARLGGEPDWPLLAAAAHAQLESGEPRLDVREEVPERLERALRARGATVRVLDLAMMGYQLVGGSVREVNGRRVAQVAYRNAEGRFLLCEMFPGADIRLPPPSEERRQGAIVFSVYGRAGRTAVFWREGETLCGLVSGGSRDVVVALAMAKARVP